MSLLKTALRYVLYSLLAVAIALAAVAFWQRKAITNIVQSWDVLMEGAEWGEAGKDVDALVGYLVANPRSFSLALWEVGGQGPTLLHLPDQPRPLASTVKLLVLAAYADAVVAGTLDPQEAVDRAKWDGLHLPRTDGGAHDRALRELAERGEELRWADVARAMIVHSDNAAADLLMLRLGEQALRQAALAHAGPLEEVPYPLNGTLLIATAEPGVEPADAIAQAGTDRARIAAQAWRHAERLAQDGAFREAQHLLFEERGLSLKDQRELTRRLGVRGTARGYATLMEQVVAAPPDSEWAKVMAGLVEWPLQKAGNAERFVRLGTKGGSLAGVLTGATFAQQKGQPPRVVALFLEDVPLALWGSLIQRFTQQELEQRLLTDPGFASGLDEKLRGVEPPAAPLP